MKFKVGDTVVIKDGPYKHSIGTVEETLSRVVLVKFDDNTHSKLLENQLKLYKPKTKIQGVTRSTYRNMVFDLVQGEAFKQYGLDTKSTLSILATIESRLFGAES